MSIISDGAKRSEAIPWRFETIGLERAGIATSAFGLLAMTLMSA
jgi:hypothetical protein